MPLFFLQSGPPLPPSAGPGVPIVAMFLMLIPVLMVIAGTVLGFRALRDIRQWNGTLGGPVLATLAAGLLPAAVILIVCGGGLLMLAEEISPVAGRKEDLWVTLGVLVGLWFSFLMMRAMHRHATGWVRPVPAGSRSGLTVAAIVLTILGAALFFLILVVPEQHQAVFGGNMAHPPGVYLVGDTYRGMALLTALTLTGGLICGVIGRRETAAKVCAWISGSLFVAAVLLFS